MELSRLEIAKLQKRAEDWEQKDVVAFEKTIADLREKLARNVSALDDAEEKLAAAERKAAEWAARYGTEQVTECISDNDLADKMLAAMKSAAHWKSEATTLGLQLAHLEERIADREDFGSRVYGDRQHWKEQAEKAARELESYAATDRTASLALVDVTRERDDAVLSMRQISDARDQILLEIDAANAKVERLREAGDAVAKALNERCNAAEGPWSGSEFAAWEDWDRARAALTETGGDDDETSEERDDGRSTRRR